MIKNHDLFGMKFATYPATIKMENAEYVHDVGTKILKLSNVGSSVYDDLYYFGCIDFDMRSTKIKHRIMNKIFDVIYKILNTLFFYPVTIDNVVYSGKDPIRAGGSIFIAELNKLPEELKEYCIENEIRLITVECDICGFEPYIYLADTPIPVSEMSGAQIFAAQYVLEGEILTELANVLKFDTDHLFTEPDFRKPVDWNDPIWVDAPTTGMLLKEERGYEYGIFTNAETKGE